MDELIRDDLCLCLLLSKRREVVVFSEGRFFLLRECTD